MKRRLELLPEVLPAPERSVVTGVRARTIARLKVLAALGSVGIAAGCDDEASGTADDGRCTGPSDPYRVVDPIPPPACFTRGPIMAAAVFNDSIDPTDAGDALDAGDSGQRRFVDVILTFEQQGVVVGGFDSPDDHVELIESGPRAKGLRLVVAVPAHLTNASAELRVSCATGPSALEIDLTLEPVLSVTVTER